MSDDNLIDLSTLRTKLGNRARQSIYTDVAAGRLPKPFKIGGKNYWRLSEIEDAITAMQKAA